MEATLFIAIKAHKARFRVEFSNERPPFTSHSSIARFFRDDDYIFPSDDYIFPIDVRVP